MRATAGLAVARAEQAAREAYGRLLAILAARSRDIAAAEDALCDALVAALATWPARGIPERPEAWLLVAARRQMLQGHRHDAVRTEAASTLRMVAEELAEVDHGPIPDDRLKLLFTCAHPDIEAELQAPLMLQVVLGLDAARIAAAFLVAPSTMGQRLVRAKARIRTRALAFVVPEPEELAGRLQAVLDAVYAAYGTAWDSVAGADPRGRGLALESLYLARLLAALLPAEPEALGLLALLLHCEARAATRRDADGAYVPLGAQDPTGWSAPLLAEAEAALLTAAPMKRHGRYQIEAAIQSAHAAAHRGVPVPAEALALLYERLVQLAPVIGTHVARAAAIGAWRGPEAGLAQLARLSSERVASYQPFWALRAHLLAQAGDRAMAAEAYARAAGLAEDPAVRTFLLGRRRGLGS